MVSNKMDMIHSQIIISELMKAILTEIDLPMEVSKLEGDAVFLYAVRETDPVIWVQHREQISGKLFKFFQVFSDRMAHLIHSNTCHCKSCTNISHS